MNSQPDDSPTIDTPASSEQPENHLLSVDDLLRLTLERNASDLHLTVGLPPMLRVHGTLLPVPDQPRLTSEDTEAMAQQLTNADQWRKFLETCEMDFSVGRKGLARFRVNLFLQRGSVAVALRLIPREIPAFDQLGLPRILETFAMKDHGLFLVTGPTGSGKSTSLAAMVDYINNNRNAHVVTIEDPIEYLHRHKKCIVNQREMFMDTQSFHEALRHVLRQDPDVILIGEMRDLETIQIALTLAETGHLVLATLHTADTTQALTRIIDVFPPHQQTQARIQLSLVLVGIMAQVLLPRADNAGRVVAYEILTGTPAVSHMIRSAEVQQVYTAIQTGAADGMCSLNTALLQLVRKRMITSETALHKSPRQKELLEQLRTIN